MEQYQDADAPNVRVPRSVRLYSTYVDPAYARVAE